MPTSTMSERTVARTIIKWLRLVLPTGALVAAIVNEARGSGLTPFQRAHYGQARKASGVVTGFPDAVAALPLGRVIWFEFKKPKTGIVSEAQSLIHEHLRQLSHIVIVCDSIETARFGLMSAGIKLNEAPGQLVVAPKIRSKRRTIAADAVPSW